MMAGESGETVMQRFHFDVRHGITRAAFATALGAVLTLGTACVSYPKIKNEAGSPTRVEDMTRPSALGGVGIESEDVIGMTQQMLRDMLTCPELASRVVPPRIAIDATYFRNESSNRINMGIITNRLRVELNRAAAGRMTFVGMHYADMVSHNRELKRDGVVDGGTVGQAVAPKAPDYQLGGAFTSLDGMSQDSGAISRYNQVVFEMVNVETGEIVWSGMYEIRKAAQEHVIYR
jgi:hypothetical protein